MNNEGCDFLISHKLNLKKSSLAQSKHMCSEKENVNCPIKHWLIGDVSRSYQCTRADKADQRKYGTDGVSHAGILLNKRCRRKLMN